MGLIPLKGRYPFRLATTSFIYPAGYAANVGMLAPYVDEIELLFFQSDPKSLPSPGITAELERLAIREHITYNVHLPLDVDLGSASSTTRRQAVTALTIAVARVQPLSPTSYTLHLPYSDTDRGPDAVAAWQRRTAESVARLLAQTGLNSHEICVETLDYPPAWFLPLLDQFDLASCLDIGHLIRYGYSVDSILTDYLDRTRVFHLHGVRPGKDHVSLDELDPAIKRKLAVVLPRFSGSVSLEVFSLRHLEDSMRCLARMMDQPESGRAGDP